MLTPEQLQNIVETVQPVLDELNEWIIKDIVKRVMGRLQNFDELEMTSTSQWQAQVMIDAGGHLRDLERELAKFTSKSRSEIRRIFQQAGLYAYEADAEVMRRSGVDVPPLRQSPRMLQILEDTYERTEGELTNYTRTTADKSQQELIKALDLAHIKVMSGATSYTEAVRDTVLSLADHQAKVIYPTGHVDNLEVAVLRAVRTGTAQASGNMTVDLMDQYKWDIVLTSAHLGARYGDGGENPGNHYWWQGRFFSISGTDPRFPPFVKSTGYGTGPGLCGWNCRHSFGPGDGVHNPWKHYDREANKKAYDLSQEQRAMERAIRKQKRRVMAVRTALDTYDTPSIRSSLQETYTAEYDKLGRLNADYNAFCDKHGLPRMSDRLEVAEWNYKKALQAYQSGSPIKAKMASGASGSRTPNYRDVTDNWYPDAVPGSHEVRDLQEYTANGVTYTVDGDNVILAYNSHEKDVANVLAKDVGGEIFMVPKVDKPDGVPTPDYLFHGRKYDLKTLEPSAGKNTIVHRVKSSVQKKQADNFIIDVTKSGLDDETILAQIDKIFWSKDTRIVRDVVIIRDLNIEKVYRRNEES